MSVGLSLFEAQNLPLGLLGDLIAIEQYKSSEDMRMKLTEEQEAEEFFRLCSFK